MKMEFPTPGEYELWIEKVHTSDDRVLVPNPGDECGVPVHPIRGIHSSCRPERGRCL